MLGTAGLPHILMRFFTVPDAKAARGSVVWAVGLIGAFYVMTTFFGFGARAILGGSSATEAEVGADTGANLAAPILAQEVGGGAGTVGGDAFLAIISAVAFATILAGVAGLVISASGAVAHDVWANIVRRGKQSDREEIVAARVAALGIGAIAIAIAIAIISGGANVSYLVGLAFAVAASANFPALVLALTWRRFNTTGAVAGVLVGTITSIGLVVIGPDVSGEGALISLTQPGIISIPAAFIACIVGTLATSQEGKAECHFDELYVRSETGLGAEVGSAEGGIRPRSGQAAPAATSIVPL